MSDTTSTLEGANDGRLKRLRSKVISVLRDPSHDAVAKRTAMLAFAIRVTSAAIAYITQIVLARWMGVHDYGIYVFVWTWVLFLGNISGLGFGIGSLRFVPEHQEKGEQDLLRGYLLASRLSGLVAGTLFALAAFGVIRLLGPIVDSHYVWPLILCLICLPSFAVTETQDGIARAINAPAIALAPPYILRPLLLLVFMVIEHEVGMQATAASALECAIAATWLTLVIQYVLLAVRLRQAVPPGKRSFRLRYWLGASLPIVLAESAGVLSLNVDVFILAAFVEPNQVGVYYAVTKTLVLGAFVGFAVGAAVAHRYAEYHVAGDKERLQEFVLRSAAWTFWPTLATIVLMLALGRPFLALFGPDFVEGYPLMLILSIGLLARAAVGPVERLLPVLGEQGAMARIVIATLVVAIALHLALVPVFGAAGSAAAAGLAAMVQAAMFVWIAKKRLGLRIGVWQRGPRS